MNQTIGTSRKAKVAAATLGVLLATLTLGVGVANANETPDDDAVETVDVTVAPDPVAPEPVVEPVVEVAAAVAAVAELVTDEPTLEAVVGPNYIETSHTLTPGGVDITLHSVNPWIYPTSVVIDGVHSYGPTVDNRTDGKLNGPQKDASKTRSIVFDNCTGTHTVSYRVDAGSEKDLYVGLPVGTWTDLTIESVCDFVTVAWLAPGGAPPNHFDVTQTTPTDGSWTAHTGDPDRDAVDGLIAAYALTLACGEDADFQVDVYLDDPTTAGLIAGGVLHGPNNPTEHLAGDYMEGKPWKFVHVEAPATACVPDEPDPYSTYTEWVDGEFGCGDDEVEQARTRVDVTYTLVDNVWVEHASDPVEETQVRVLTEGEMFDCPVPVVPSSSSGLPNTGGPDLPAIGLLATLMLALGFAITLAAKMARH